MTVLETAERIDRAIQDKAKMLAATAMIRSWRMQIGAPSGALAPEGALAPDFDDQDWASITLPRTWSSKDGEAWFHTRLDLPGQVEGIRLTGSKLELEILLPIGATIYVDGKEMYSEPSWADTRAVRLLLAERFRPETPLALVVRCRAGDGFGVFIESNLRFSSLDNAIFELDLLRAQLAFTRFLAGQAEAGRSAGVGPGG